MDNKRLFVVILSVIIVSGLIFAVKWMYAGVENSVDGNGRILKNITPKAAFLLIQDNKNNPDFIIVDLRTPEEFSSGHVENALNIDYLAATFKDKINELDKNKTYLIYCRSGGRSGRSIKIMDKLGFKKVYNMTGGIIQWEKDNLKIIYPRKNG